MTKALVIDSHQHFWQIGKHDCTWPTPELVAIYRDFGPADLAPLAQTLGVTGTVLVQSQTRDADTDFLLQLANESDLVKAVVGWVDLASGDASSRIRHLAQHPKMRGLRPMLQSMPEDDWILSDSIQPAIIEMQQNNLSLDALVHVRHLPSLRVLAERYPGLAIVINHAAKPAIAADEFEHWAVAMEDLAELPQVYCKLSGLLTEATAVQGVEQLRPYVLKLYDLFGAERLMWGSDWPVLTLAPNNVYATYSDWLDMARQLLSPLPEHERDAIFGLTAKNFYRF